MASEYGHQIFFYLLLCVGQLQNRLIQPYLTMPLRLAALVDVSRSEASRLELADGLLKKSDCCLEKHFARPVVGELRKAGDVRAILPGHELHNNLADSFRMKTCNLEIECNFARASSMRAAMRGRKHSISSLTAKHIGAEIKLGQKRMILRSKRMGQYRAPVQHKPLRFSSLKSKVHFSIYSPICRL